MPTQEQKITVLEENMTILLGIASGQERDIKSIQIGVISLERRFDSLEGRLYGMDHRLSTLEKRFDALEKRFDTLEKGFDGLEQGFGALEKQFDALEQSVSGRFEEQGKKLDQILLLLTTRPGQER